MATIIQKLFDPLKQTIKEDEEGLYEFKHFVKIEAILPDNMHYFHIEPPHLPYQYYELVGPGKNSKILQTDNNGNFLQLYLDIRGKIKCITYYGRSGTISTKNLCKLYDIHERNLNGMVSRYEGGLIKDFTKFLNENWVFPLYHDGFKEFEERELKMAILGGKRFSETRLLFESNPNDAPIQMRRTKEGSQMETSITEYLKQILPNV